MTQSAGPNYEVHDEVYRQLRRGGFQGWGGDALSKRMEGWGRTVQDLITHPRFPKTGHILDVGSGAGDSSIPFAQAGYEISGLEISNAAVEWAQEKFQSQNLKANFFVGDASRFWPFLDGNFHAVIDSACLHCLIGEDRVSFLNEAWRVLRPEGFLLVSSMVGDPKAIDDSIEYDPLTRCQVKNGIPYRFMSPPLELEAEVERVGFRIIERRVSENSWWDHLTLYAIKPSSRS